MVHAEGLIRLETQKPQMEGQASNPDLLELQGPLQTLDRDERFSMLSLEYEVKGDVHVHPHSETRSTLYLLALTIGLGG
jgi:hypothetical protein